MNATKRVRTSPPDPRLPRHDDEDGTALVLALFFTILVTGFVVTGSMQTHATQVNTDTKFRTSAQAATFAQSGLTEALAWFRRQTTQPVVEFVPRDDGGDVVDTADAELGIVREFRISGDTWGRYEVWRSTGEEPSTNSIDPRARWRSALAATDVSDERRIAVAGTMWRLRSIGYVFERRDASEPFRRHQVLASAVLESEIVRGVLAPPGSAALAIRNGANLTLGLGARIRGANGAGVYYSADTRAPAGGDVVGNPGIAPAPQYSDRVEDVFGLPFVDLRRTADDYVTDNAAFPRPVPRDSFIVAETGEVRFTRSMPLMGSGVVCVRGNVVVEAGSNSVFNGMLYVDGDLTIDAPAEITGAVVATGRVTIRGSVDFVTITYDEPMLNRLRGEIGQYRRVGAVRPIQRGWGDAPRQSLDAALGGGGDLGEVPLGGGPGGTAPILPLEPIGTDGLGEHVPPVEPTPIDVQPTEPVVTPTEPVVTPTEPVVEPTEPVVEPEPVATPRQPTRKARTTKKKK